MQFKNAIDLDKCVNIPNKLLNHLFMYHQYVFVRYSASRKGLHILTEGESLCSICSQYSDQNFVRIQEAGKPLILWTTKTYRKGNLKYKKRASNWLKMEN